MSFYFPFRCRIKLWPGRCGKGWDISYWQTWRQISGIGLLDPASPVVLEVLLMSGKQTPSSERVG